MSQHKKLVDALLDAQLDAQEIWLRAEQEAPTKPVVAVMRRLAQLVTSKKMSAEAARKLFIEVFKTAAVRSYVEHADDILRVADETSDLVTREAKALGGELVTIPKVTKADRERRDEERKALRKKVADGSA